jgi:hypothetical protein
MLLIPPKITIVYVLQGERPTCHRNGPAWCDQERSQRPARFPGSHKSASRTRIWALENDRRRPSHQQARGQILMACCPQARHRHICAYQPGPNSSNSSCTVFASQTWQKRRNDSVWSAERGAPWRARSNNDDQSPYASNVRCHRLEPLPPSRPARCGVEARGDASRLRRAL